MTRPAARDRAGQSGRAAMPLARGVFVPAMRKPRSMPLAQQVSAAPTGKLIDSVQKMLVSRPCRGSQTPLSPKMDARTSKAEEEDDEEEEFT